MRGKVKKKSRPSAIELITQLRSEMEINLSETSRRLNVQGDMTTELSRRLNELRTQTFTSGPEVFNQAEALSEMAREIATLQTMARVANDHISGLRTIANVYNDRLNNLDARGYKEPRVLKGGWMNIYEADTDGMINFNGAPYPAQGPFTSRESANACAHVGRVACVWIGDVTEGEGL